MPSSDSRIPSAAGNCSATGAGNVAAVSHTSASPTVISVSPLNSLTAPRTCTTSPAATSRPLGE